LFAKNAREHALEFNEEKIVPVYEKFYEKVLNN